MQNIFRLLMLLGIAGSAMTALGSGMAWWMDEERRLSRLVQRVLGGEPDGLLVARGRNAAVGFRLAAGKIVVMRAGGAKAVLYPLGLLIGAELSVDDQVVGRALRDEPRRPLDQIAAGARRVTLRLMFDDPAHPDFELDLWLPQDLQRRNALTPAAAIVEGRTWLGRAEALVRRPPKPGFRRSAGDPDPPLLSSPEVYVDDDDAEEDAYVAPQQGTLL